MGRRKGGVWGLLCALIGVGVLTLLSATPAVSQDASLEEVEKQLKQRQADAARQRAEAARRQAEAARAAREREAAAARAEEERAAAARAEEARVAAARAEEARAAAFRALAEDMVDLPGGTFRMGDLSGDGLSTEQPVRTVSIRPFQLGKYEVTVALWRLYLADEPQAAEGTGSADTVPVTDISWNDAQGFIRWLNGRTGKSYRLPSEAEWEYAARAGSTTRYPWGDEYSASRANGEGTSEADRWDGVAPVGSFPANSWGLHDMIGNVSEWTQDCLNYSYEGAPVDGRAWESSDCKYRVVRGGGWLNRPAWLRSASRSNFWPAGLPRQLHRSPFGQGSLRLWDLGYRPLP